MSFLVNPYWFVTAGGCTDADANAFITATGITDDTIKSAICALVTSMKATGTWSKMIAIYPFVGGTATTHKFNLKNPADSAAAFCLSFAGGWTHNSNGITGNGTNAVAQTFVNNQILALNSNHISSYSRTNIDEPSVDMGSLGFSDGIHHAPRFTAVGAFFRVFLSGTPAAANSNSTGLYTSSRTASNLTKMYKNGSTIITSALASTTQSNNTIFIGAYGGTSLYTTRNLAFATIGEGLNDAEAAALYSSVQAFQTTLGRQV